MPAWKPAEPLYFWCQIKNVIRRGHNTRASPVEDSIACVQGDFAAALVLCRDFAMSEGFARLLVLFALFLFGSAVKFSEPMTLG